MYVLRASDKTFGLQVPHLVCSCLEPGTRKGPARSLPTYLSGLSSLLHLPPNSGEPTGQWGGEQGWAQAMRVREQAKGTSPGWGKAWPGGNKVHCSPSLFPSTQWTQHPTDAQLMLEERAQ